MTRPEILESQLEGLLRDAAGFDPGVLPPAGLLERAVARSRRPVARGRSRQHVAGLLWGALAGTAAASATAALVVATSQPTSPGNSAPTEIALTTPGSTTGPERSAAGIGPHNLTHARPARRVRARWLASAAPAAERKATADPQPRDEGPVLTAHWTEETVEHTVTRVVQPALRLSVNDRGELVAEPGLLSATHVDSCAPEDLPTDEPTAAPALPSPGESPASLELNCARAPMPEPVLAPPSATPPEAGHAETTTS